MIRPARSVRVHLRAAHPVCCFVPGMLQPQLQSYSIMLVEKGVHCTSQLQSSARLEIHVTSKLSFGVSYTKRHQHAGDVYDIRAIRRTA
jgi:hypothetical protein